MKAAIMVAAAAMLAASAATAQPSDVRHLIAAVQRVDDACRGGSGDDPKTVAACHKRDALYDHLKAKGWCWGPPEAIDADQHWMKCPR